MHARGFVFRNVSEFDALRAARFKALQDNIGMRRVRNGRKRRIHVVPNADFGFARFLFNGRFALKRLEHQQRLS